MKTVESFPKALPQLPGQGLSGPLKTLRTEALQFFRQTAAEHGDVVGFRLLWHRFALISHPELVGQVLVTQNDNFVKHQGARFLIPVLGRGLLTNEGAAWRRQRRLIQPDFGHQQILRHADLILQLTNKACDRLQSGETYDLQEELTQLTLSIITQAILGADLDEQVPGSSQVIAEVVQVIQEDFALRWIGQRLPYWVPTAGNRRVKAVIKSLDEVLAKILQKKRKAPGGNDLLSRLLQATDVEDGQGMSSEQLRDEVVTLLLAGHETTAHTLVWSLWLLGRHPELQQQAASQVDAICGQARLTPELLPQLEGVKRIVQESMRLYSPAYVVGRQALRDCQLGDFRVPAGTNVLMSQWVIHRDPRFWDEPEEFRPDRWTEDHVPKHKYAYFPFGGGPRVCIGNAFAMMEATLILSEWLRRFDCQLVNGHMVKPWPCVTLRPSGSVWATLTARQPCHT